MRDLLPINASKEERALSLTTERALNVPVTVRELWNPQTCPVNVLPWLAWSLSLDEWDTNWTEAQKRGAIEASVQVHRRKGTVGALKRALQALGYEVEINEDTGEAYTFRVEIEASQRGITNVDLYERAQETALLNKNVRSHLAGIDASLRSEGSVYVGGVMISGEQTEVLPKPNGELGSMAVLYVGAAEQTVDTVTVCPATELIFNGSGFISKTGGAFTTNIETEI